MHHMKATYKRFIFVAIIGLVMFISAICVVLIRERPRFVERPPTKEFLERLRLGITSGAAWTRKPQDIAAELIRSEIFPPKRPPLTGDTSFFVQEQSSQQCMIEVMEGFPESDDIIAVWDKVYFSREGNFWIPSRRQVSWQITKEPGWSTHN